ncbi:MAG TPA: calcium/sodium antiporter [Halobacteriales archaeon]|nr:calcium/sodium antiporter [Halobacteriales archaeon]
MSVAPILVDVALVAAAVVALWLGARHLVDGATLVAGRLGLPGLVVGLTVVAFGTSAPEFAVTVDAALAGEADVSVANVVGSNVVNLGFVLGASAVVRALPTSTALVRRDGVVLLGTTALVFVLLGDLLLSRPEGVLLFAMLVAYLAVLARSGSDRVRIDDEAIDTVGPAAVIGLLGGLAVVLAGAHLLVLSAVGLARDVGVSEWTIGVTVVAAGTSVPEFATSVVAVRRGRPGLSAGNLVGSCIFNLLGVLGLAASVRALPVAASATASMWWLAAFVVVAITLLWTRRVLSRLEGGLLIVLNAVNWIVDFLP